MRRRARPTGRASPGLPATPGHEAPTLVRAAGAPLKRGAPLRRGARICALPRHCLPRIIPAKYCLGAVDSRAATLRRRRCARFMAARRASSGAASPKARGPRTRSRRHDAVERRQGARHRACPPPGNRGADLGGRLS